MVTVGTAGALVAEAVGAMFSPCRLRGERSVRRSRWGPEIAGCLVDLHRWPGDGSGGRRCAVDVRTGLGDKGRLSGRRPAAARAGAGSEIPFQRLVKRRRKA